MRLLSVDWDYFFPKVEDTSQPAFKDQWWFYDWGHKESKLFIHALWPMRGAEFVHNNLPLPTTTGEEQTFWSRFHIKPRATLYLAESHAWAVEPRVFRNITEVWSFDAHHDCGYHSLDGELKTIVQNNGGMKVSCDNWLVAYRLMGVDDIHIRYPRWRSYWPKFEETCALDNGSIVPPARSTDTGEPVALSFDRVFICRSGAWTPPWVDEAFWTFVKAAPIRRVIALQYIDDRSHWHKDMEQHIKEREEFDRLRHTLPVAGGHTAQEEETSGIPNKGGER